MGKRELVALLNLSSWCLMMVERLFLVVPPGCLRFVIAVFPDHTHLLFLNINNGYFDNMVSQIYPSELQLNKANTSDTEAAFLHLHLSISNNIVSTKIYDKL